MALMLACPGAVVKGAIGHRGHDIQEWGRQPGGIEVDLIAAFRVFLHVAEAGSFSAAARDLGVGQPAVSKQMAALERQLATRLFNRSSHAFSLSDDGLALLDQARTAVEAVDQTQDLARLRRQQLGGALRLAAPVVFGRTRLVPIVCELVRLYPQLQLDLILDDRFVDLVEERIDLAVRVGVITDASLVARALPPVRRVALAAPTYLQQRGTPQHPHDLRTHDCVVYTRLATGARWTFERDNQPIEVEVKGPVKINNSAGVLAAVAAGAGIGVVPMFTLTDELERGAVQLVLQDFEPQALPMHIVYASRRHVPAKLRLAIEHLLQTLGEGKGGGSA